MELRMAFGKVGELGNFIRDQRRTARLSLRKLSKAAGISNPYLSQIERGLRRPSAEILQSLARALRLSSENLYVKAGILEGRGGAPDPVTAILRDLTITEKQKQALIEVYQSFRHENERDGAGAPKKERSAAARRAHAPRGGTRVPARAKPKRRAQTRRPATRRRARA
jgi:transcriptional regulator with XRE-family HTH domain